MRTLRAFAAILEANRKVASKDPRLAVAGLLIPLLILVLIGTFIGKSRNLPLGYVERDRGSVSKALLGILEHSPQIELRAYPSFSRLKDDVLKGRVVAGLYIPPSFSEGALKGSGSSLTLVAPIGSQDAITARLYVIEASALVGADVTASRLAEKDKGAVYAYALSLTRSLYRDLSRLQSQHLSNPYSYTTAGQAVLFAFITVMGASTLMVESRRSGLLRRILAAPVPALSIIAAQFVALALTGVAQLVVLLLIGKFLFGVELTHPAAIALLVGSTAVVAASAGVLVGVYARSPEQALTLTTIVGIAAGMIGGCLWPVSIVGPVMRQLAKITPQNWAMEGFTKLIISHAAPTSVVGDAAVLICFAAGLLAVALSGIRRVLTS